MFDFCKMNYFIPSALNIKLMDIIKHRNLPMVGKGIN